MLKTNQKNLLLGELVALVLVMGIAFSVFSTNLNIEGTSNISNTWDLRITNIQTKNIVGHAKDDEENPASYNELTANFNALLYYEGDSITYDITLKNNGTLDAALDKNVTPQINTNSNKIKVELTGFKTKGDVITKGGGEAVTTVKITYLSDAALADTDNNIKQLLNKENITPQLMDTETKPEASITITYPFKQEGESGAEPTTKHLVEYDCTTNGGTSCSDYEEYVYSNVDLSKEGEKQGYTFVGWNTDSNATTGLSELSISNNITLYAIYKKTLTLTYTKRNNVSSVGKETDTCDIYNKAEVTCTKTLPSITPNNGYTSKGWYKDNEKVGEENSSYTFTEDTTLTSEVIQNNPLVITGKSGLTYTGSSQDLLEVTTNGINDVYYSTTELTKDNYTNGSTTIPTGTNADTYTICYFSLGNDNYGDAKGSLEVSISKATPTITLSATSGITSSGGGKATFTEKANVAGSFGNTSSSTGVATVSPTTTSTINANTDQTVTLTGGSTVTGTNGSTSIITVTFTPTDTTNYNTITSTSASKKTYTVRNEKVPTITDNGGGSFTINYNGICNITGITCKYSTNGGNSFTTLTGTDKTNSSYTGTLPTDNTVVGRINYGSNFISASKLIELPRTAATTIAKLNATVIASGDGLYKDSTETDRYIYRGVNPSNYICLGDLSNGICPSDSLYRIISVESDGAIKVIKNDSIGEILWDPAYDTALTYNEAVTITTGRSVVGTRRQSTFSSSTYFCRDGYTEANTTYRGCKSWGSSSSTYNSLGTTKVTEMPSGINETARTLPTYNSWINTFLNGGTYHAQASTTDITGWYDGNSTGLNSIAKSKIVTDHAFNIGPVSADSSYTLADNRTQEKAYKWKGKVGLMNVTDYVGASTNSACYNVNRQHVSWCNNSSYNWLYTSSYEWTISPDASGVNTVWYVNKDSLATYSTEMNNEVRPVMFLSANTALTGSGTNDSNVYRITS